MERGDTYGVEDHEAVPHEEEEGGELSEAGSVGST